MISICIITKNEEERLDKCLSCIEYLGYEIVVVDTGSTDKTKEVALKYTDKVYDFEWCNDFSAARNFSLEKASNEYVFVLDSDEYLIKFDKDIIEKHLKKYPKILGILSRKEYFAYSSGEERTSISTTTRFFSKKLYKYAGKIHEQVVTLDGKYDYDTVMFPALVDHVGYVQTDVDKEKKTKRNLDLLFEELEENPEDPYIIYQIGKSYYYVDDFKRALHYFKKTLDFDLNPKLIYLSDLIETYGYTLIHLKYYKTALLLEKVYKDFEYSCDFIYLIGLIYMHNEMYDEALREFEKTITYKECKVEGVNSFLSYYNLGVINEIRGNYEKAIEFYEKGLAYQPSKDRLKIVKERLK